MSPLPSPLSLIAPARSRPSSPQAAPADASPDVAIPVRLPGELRRRIGAIAKRTGVTAAELIATGVAEYLGALEARLAAGGAVTKGHAASPGSRVRAQVQAHADRQAQAQAKIERQTQARVQAQPQPEPCDPLDRFFAKLSSQEAFERTYSGSATKPAAGTS